jgi:hypothetical protein
MLRLAKAFWDLALWRMSPAQLPASVFLLCLLAAILAVLEVLAALLPPPASLGQIGARILLSVALPLVWTWVVLLAVRRRQRYLQTASALLGIAVLSELVLYPLAWLMQSIGSAEPIAEVLKFLALVGIVWYLLACANIWRAALESRLGLGMALSLAYFIGSTLLEIRLLPVA